MTSDLGFLHVIIASFKKELIITLISVNIVYFDMVRQDSKN